MRVDTGFWIRLVCSPKTAKWDRRSIDLEREARRAVWGGLPARSRLPGGCSDIFISIIAQSLGRPAILVAGQWLICKSRLVGGCGLVARPTLWVF